MRSFTDVAVLDIAEAASEISKTGLGARAGQVTWIVADMTRWAPTMAWDIWQDRAVFHFLTGAAQQDAYIAALTAATRPEATVIVSTFALDGPEKCTGLPIQRFSPETLARRLGPALVLTSGASESHKTPWDSEQRFSHAVLRRR